VQAVSEIVGNPKPERRDASDLDSDVPPPSYHDLHITTAEIPRTSIFNLPYGLEVTCNRVTGWYLTRLEESSLRGSKVVLAGEYDEPEKWLILDVAGHTVVDSRATAGKRRDCE
jgi:hypothetical protein